MTNMFEYVIIISNMSLQLMYHSRELARHGCRQCQREAVGDRARAHRLTEHNFAELGLVLALVAECSGLGFEVDDAVLAIAEQDG